MNVKLTLMTTANGAAAEDPARERQADLLKSTSGFCKEISDSRPGSVTQISSIVIQCILHKPVRHDGMGQRLSSQPLASCVRCQSNT